MEFHAYWPWWIGAAAIAVIFTGYWRVSGTPLGLSGMLANLFDIESPTGTPAEQSRLLVLQVLFIGAMVAGAALSSLTWGSLAPRNALGPVFFAHFGNGTGAVAALFGGGLLVGFGARLGGGCTSGHGISGCARLSPRSIAATGTFLFTGILTALLVSEVLR